MTDTTAVYAEIVKHERDANGDLVVYGRATGPDLDLDKQICDPDWLKQAMPEWFKSAANVREQHSSIAAGVGQEIKQLPDGGWDLKALVVDANSARKVERGVLKGYSIGIRAPQVIRDKSAPGGRITGGSIVEVSLVDRPANPTCQLTLAKALKPGPVTAQAIDAERHLVKVEELYEASELTRGGLDIDEDIEKRDFSAGERREAASEGQAQSDGSFPIKNAKDLANAIRLAGNAKDPAKAKAHIKRRAAALGLSDKIPDSWKAAAAVEAIEALDVDLSKASSSGDVRNAKKAIAIIARLIQNEAECLAGGMESEACDIELLLGAVKALEWFICAEKKEPAVAHVELADQADTEKAAAPDAAQTVPASQAEGTETPPPAADKAAEGEQDTDLTELVKAAVAEAVAPIQAQLAKAMEQPAPGGPVLTRTTEDTTKAAAREIHLNKAEHYDRLAYEVTDPQARAGYLQMAADERAAATS
jgi:hypothetical protein